MSVPVQPRPSYIAAFIAGIWLGPLVCTILCYFFIETPIKEPLHKRIFIATALCLLFQIIAILMSPESRAKIFLQIVAMNMMFVGIGSFLTFPIVALSRIKYHHVIAINDWGILFLSIALLVAAKYLFRHLRQSDTYQQNGEIGHSLTKPPSPEFHRADVPPERREE